MSEDEVKYSGTEAKLGRIFLVKIHPGADMVKTIEKFCKDHDIEYAYFNMVHGGFEEAVFGVFGPKVIGEAGMVKPEDRKGHDWFNFPGVDINRPINLLAGSGWLQDGEKEGSREVVAHYVLGGSIWNQAALGGHVRNGNKVLTSIEVIIFEIKKAKIIRERDHIGLHTNFVPE